MKKKCQRGVGFSRWYRAANMWKNPIVNTPNVSTMHEQGYVCGRELGRGSYGVVIEVRSSKCEGEVLACKSLSKAHLLDDGDVIKLEIEMMARLSSHPNVIHLNAVYEDDDHVHLLMELCSGGELYDRLLEKRHLSEMNAAIVFRQLMETVSYLHEQGIMHRDLKPKNILITAADWKIKVANFGLAAYIKSRQHLADNAGTPFYTAPEVLMGKYNSKADIWSCGVIHFVLLCGTQPFYAQDVMHIYRKVRCEQLRFPPHFSNIISVEAKGLIESMLKRDVCRRPTTKQVLKYPWLLRHRNTTEEDHN